MNPTKRTCSAAAALVLLILSGISAEAGENYYRWLDAQNNPVNSDRPPPAGIDYETIATSTNRSVPETAGEENSAPGATPTQTSEPGQEDAPAQRFAVIKNPEACTAAQQNLETLNTYARVRMPDGQGSFRFLNEEEKATERSQAEATIKQNCE